MSKATHQRTVHADARSRRAGRASSVLAATLMSALASAGVPQVAGQTTQVRGIPAQAATGAAASQVPRDAQASPASETQATDDIAPAGTDIATPPAVMPTLRAVLFRVTPPATSLLPAEAAQDANAPATTAPVEGVASMPPSNPSTTTPAAPVGASYLLATIHFGTPEEQGIDYASVERTLASVDTFVNEADLDEAWKPDYDAYRWLPPESPLSTMIGKDAISKAHALLPAVRMQDLDRMKPWSVLALLEARGESGGEATMDARLQRMAAAGGKRVLHLESLEEQLRALDCVPAPEHARVLDERLRASWILRIESAQAMAWYRARNLDAWLADIDRMEGLSDESKAIEQRARECLLEQRNARWIGQLQTLFQDGPCLVAVGAVHLVGSQGLLSALRRDGYRVEAMPL